MKIAELLQAKGASVATIGRDETVAEAIRQLDARRVGALVVSTDGRRVEGIISERDVVRRLARSGPGVLDETVAAIMVAEVKTCAPVDEVDSLMDVMTSGRFRHVPVVDDGALAGIVSIGDVVKARVDELKDDRRALHEYIDAR